MVIIDTLFYNAGWLHCALINRSRSHETSAEKGYFNIFLDKSITDSDNKENRNQYPYRKWRIDFKLVKFNVSFLLMLTIFVV